MPKFRVMFPGPWGDPGSVIEMSQEEYTAIHLNATAQQLEPLPEDADLLFIPPGTLALDSPLDVLMRERRAETMFMMDQYRALVMQRVRSYIGEQSVPMFRDYIPEGEAAEAAAQAPEPIAKMVIPEAVMKAINVKPNNVEAALEATETAMAINQAFNGEPEAPAAPAAAEAEEASPAEDLVMISGETKAKAPAKAKASKAK